MSYHRWKIGQADMKKSRIMANELEISGLLSDLLISRGMDTSKKAYDSLEDVQLSSPFLLKDMDKAVARINEAIENNEKMVVYGDYDVDGITATALMFSYLDSVGAEVYFKLPNRDDEGYGLSKKAIDMIHKKGISLIITVDNGISAYDEIVYANELGVDVVVTDHHLPPDKIPPAVAVIDPLRADDESPFKKLCGAGVAFKTICGIEGCEPNEMLPYYGDLAAIGTIADIMLLQGENRRIVKEGIQSIQHTDRYGLSALLDIAGFGEKKITAENISFGISPRLNAAGRMDDATSALQLLLTEDEQEAVQLANQLNEQNIERQKTEADIIVKLAKTISEDADLQRSSVLVVWGEGFHHGVIGIAASRLVEKYGKPAIVLSIDENGEAKGSGRSFEGFNLHGAISSCEDILIRFGGHALAAGLSLNKENLHEFRRRINEYAKINSPVLHRPPINIDVGVKLQGLSVADVSSLSILEPFGAGNPAPLFFIEKAVVDAVYGIGDGKHSRIKLKQNGGSIFGVLFGVSPEAFAYKIGDEVEAAVYLSIFSGGSSDMISGRFKDIRPADLSEEYIELCELYESFQNNANLSKDQIAKICPTRQDVIDFYRIIDNNGIHSDDLRPIFKKLGANRGGKILASIDILLELNHIEIEKTEHSSVYKHNKETVKRPLTESKLWAKLQGE